MKSRGPLGRLTSSPNGPVLIARMIFVLLMTWIATLLGVETRQDPRVWSVLGFAVGCAIILVEYASNVVASRKIVLAAVGTLFGLVFAQIFYPTFGWFLNLVVQLSGIFGQLLRTFIPSWGGGGNYDPVPAMRVAPETAQVMCHMLFSYFGLVLALRHAEWFRIGRLRFHLASPSERPRLLDSSVIIDGRVADLLAYGLFPGMILIPDSVLIEIQRLADTEDEVNRNRGKRGLEILERLRAECRSLEFIPDGTDEEIDPDAMMLELARRSEADLLTADANLQKVARLHQIPAININEVADALRPAVYIGKSLDVMVVKRGKEKDQGVGYLADGAMVVIDNAAGLVNTTCRVVITSVLNNPTGRLVFARPEKAPE